MPTIEELRKVRLEKLRSLQNAGFLAYPAQTKRTHSISEALKHFSDLVKTEKEIVLAGRIMAMRGHGGATFLDINDGSGTAEKSKIQGLIKEDLVGPKGYAFFINHFDIGDFVEIKGILLTTKRGEQTIEAQDYKMLSKS